jgi:hypothetical protein
LTAGCNLSLVVFIAHKLDPSNVRSRRGDLTDVPYLTYILLANQGTLNLGMFLPAILYVVIFTWIASLALVAVHLVRSLVYLSVHHLAGLHAAELRRELRRHLLHDRVLQGPQDGT